MFRLKFSYLNHLQVAARQSLLRSDTQSIGLLKAFYSVISLIIIALALTAPHTEAAKADSLASNQIIPLDTLPSKYAKTLEAYFQEYAKVIDISGKAPTISQLKSRVKKLIKRGKNNQAIAIIIAYQAAIYDNIDTDESLYFLQLLLEHGALLSASELAQYGLDNSGVHTSSNINYLLGVHYFQQGDYQRTFSYLSAIEDSEALPAEHRDYATLIFGISLQNVKKHRESLSIYEKVNEKSHYYLHTLLNIAVANIRQGWWTDAHIAIEKALKLTTKDSKEEHNRLLLVLAYSQLQNEFYRNARETFRKIGINSIYANKALLGIGLCAMHQKDYAGALNVFSRLQAGGGNSLSVLESNLLLPYTYERVGNLDEASLRYSEAIAYYNIKKREIETQLSQLDQGIRGASEDLTGISPRLQQYSQQIAQLEPKHIDTLPAQGRQQIHALRTSIDHHINQALSEIKRDKITKIQSYLSQSQYGLAKLYDSQ